MVRFLSVLLGIFIILSNSSTGFAQTTNELKELKKDVEALKEGQKALQKDIQEIRNLIAPKKAPEFKEAIISINDSPYKGEKTARLAVVEFSDYQ
jgi:predicted  nucleic acid-binding Zn-ribbon protein